jgi:hypothetical protein
MNEALGDRARRRVPAIRDEVVEPRQELVAKPGVPASRTPLVNLS